MSIWSNIYKWCFGLVGVIIVIACILLFIPRLRRLGDLQVRKTELETRNAEQAEQIKALQIKQERFNSDPEFVEHTARQTGRIMPDEIVYRFTNAPGIIHQP